MKKIMTTNRKIFFLFFYLFLSIGNVFGETDITKEQFTEELRARITKVQEFDFIRNYALQIPLKPQETRPKIYLFGGAATSFANNIYCTLKQENKDCQKKQNRKSNQNIEISDIYDIIQDVDLVIDGTADQAKELQARLDKEFPLLQGGKSKSLWEVRPLRCSLGNKEALLNNPEISNQHTDSFSCGLIEITKNDPNSPSEIHDLLDWTNDNPVYLEDILQKKNNYRYNPHHADTTRGKDGGLNPPLISVLRYLIKVSQFGAYPIPLESENHLKKVISEIKDSDFENEYVQNWLVSNVIKLFTNAEDINQTWKMLDYFKLRKPLSEFDFLKNNNYGGLPIADWFKKEPIPELKIKKNVNEKETLEEYFKKNGFNQESYMENGQLKTGFVLSHEVKNYYAYSSMTKNHEAKINAFISRENVKGEAAKAGNGFYVSIGKKGDASCGHTGFNIHLLADPKALKGTDFSVGLIREHLVIKNRLMLKVIHEDLPILEVDSFLSSVKDGQGLDLDSTCDMAIQKKLEQIILRRLIKPSSKDIEKIIPIISSAIKEGHADRKLKLIAEWTILDYAFSLNGLSPEGLVFLKDFFRSPYFNLQNWELFFKNPEWNENEAYIEKSLELFQEVCKETEETEALSNLIELFYAYHNQNNINEPMNLWIKRALEKAYKQKLSLSNQNIILRIFMEANNNEALLLKLTDMLSGFHKLTNDIDFLGKLYRNARMGYKGAGLLFNKLITEKSWIILKAEALKRKDLLMFRNLQHLKGLSTEKQKKFHLKKKYEGKDHHPRTARNEEISILRRALEESQLPDDITDIDSLIQQGASLQEEKAPKGHLPLLELAILQVSKENTILIIRQSSSWDKAWSERSTLYKVMNKMSNSGRKSSDLKELRDIVLEMIDQGKVIKYEKLENHQKFPSPLEMAIKTGDLAIVKKILKRGASIVDATGSDGNPILFSVMKSNNLELFEFLLNKGADSKTPNKNGKSLREAAKCLEDHKTYKNIQKLLNRIK